jgi:hypothetical protein
MMESSTHGLNGHQKDHNDLTQLRGIGVVRKRWLNAVGIATIADLAQASADTIDAQAKRDGHTLSRDELDEWITQARLHHVQASLAQAEAPPMVEAAPGDCNPLAREQGAVASDPDLAPWESFASFKVDYQTRQVNGATEQRLVTYHLETDDRESWADFGTDLVVQWMRDRMEAVQPLLQVEPPIIPAAAAPGIAEITQLRVMQLQHMSLPMVADRQSPIFPDALQTTEPFALEVSLQFAGLPETDPAPPAIYRVECFAHNIATETTDSLGEVTAHLTPDNHSAHQVLLPSLLLPQPGTYRLKVLVTPQHGSAALGQFKVPMLQVV